MTWRVAFPVTARVNDDELVTADQLYMSSGVLTFLRRDGKQKICVRAFAPGQWADVRLEPMKAKPRRSATPPAAETGA